MVPREREARMGETRGGAWRKAWQDEGDAAGEGKHRGHGGTMQVYAGVGGGRYGDTGRPKVVMCHRNGSQ